jgi:hypothetical protein
LVKIGSLVKRVKSLDFLKKERFEVKSLDFEKSPRVVSKGFDQWIYQLVMIRKTILYLGKPFAFLIYGDRTYVIDSLIWASEGHLVLYFGCLHCFRINCMAFLISASYNLAGVAFFMNGSHLGSFISVQMLAAPPEEAGGATNIWTDSAQVLAIALCETFLLFGIACILKEDARN